MRKIGLVLGGLIFLSMLAVITIPACAQQNITVLMEDVSLYQGQQKNVSIMITKDTAQNVSSAGINLTFNSSVVHVLSVENSDFTVFNASINNISGLVRIVGGSTTPLIKDITLAEVTLEAIGDPGESSGLNIEIAELRDGSGDPLYPREVRNGTVSILTPSVSITSEPTEQATAPDVDANYTLTITNNGNVADTIELNITDNEADFGSLSADNFILDSGANATAYLNVNDSEEGIYNTTVCATSQGSSGVFDAVTVKTTVSTAGAPTADYLEIEDASGRSGTYVEVPVNIINVQNGLVQGICLRIDYNENVLNLTNISSSDLTVDWENELSENRHNVTIGTGETGDAIPVGSSGAVVLLNFSVIGAADETSPMNLASIELSDPYGIVGTAPAMNGIFTVVEEIPAADYLEIEDASGRSGVHVEVPISIKNVSNGPVEGIRLRIDYNESVLNLTNLTCSDLTMNWTQLQLGGDGHTMIIGTEYSEDAIPDGSTGTVVLLNFSVIGSPGDTSSMNLSLIELSDPEGTVGTAPAKSGTFTVSELGAIAGKITYACNGTEIAGVVVNLTREGTVVNTTVTNESGYYTFTDVNPDHYNVNVSKPRFFDNSTEVTVIAGETTIVDMMLGLKGDLNNDGIIADSGDVILMLRASVGDVPGDVQYDLNGNGVIADAGDVVLLLRASIGDIILL